jgi:hypothetical protein
MLGHTDIGFYKRRDFINHLSDHQFLEMDSDPQPFNRD